MIKQYRGRIEHPSQRQTYTDPQLAQAVSPVHQLVRELTHPDFRSGFIPSLYETLYVAAGDFPKDRLHPRWHRQMPALLKAISQQQNPNGSWGSDDRLDYVPDRIINTLLVLYALWKYDLLTETHIERAGHYLQFYLPGSIAQNTDKLLIAFEGLMIELLVRNRDAGITVDFNFPFDLDLLVKYRNARMAQKTEMLYQRHATIHSVLDAIESVPDIDWAGVADFQESDGSMGIYPSSTVALLDHLDPDSCAFQQGIDYLNTVMREDGSFAAFEPADDFERWWSLLALAQSPLQDQIAPLLPAAHRASVPAAGLSVSDSFSLPDVDTSSMKAATLITLGIPCDLDFLHTFYQNGVFRCYEREERTSPSANIHALMALVAEAQQQNGQIPYEYRDLFVSAMDYLLQIEADHYEDKWHLSDLYTTSHAIELFAMVLDLKISSNLRRRVVAQLDAMIGYVQRCQQADGGFGTQHFSTVEETGYAVRALCIAADQRPLDQAKLAKALPYLENHAVENDPPLWLGKALYQSLPIAKAQQYSAISWLHATLNT